MYLYVFNLSGKVSVDYVVFNWSEDFIFSLAMATVRGLIVPTFFLTKG